MIRGFVLLAAAIAALTMILWGAAVPAIYGFYGSTGIALVVASVVGIFWLQQRRDKVSVTSRTVGASADPYISAALVELQTRVRSGGGDPSMRRGEDLERLAAQIAS